MNAATVVSTGRVEPSALTCPDCGGALWESGDGNLARYACHVGHGFSAEALEISQNENLETALWSAVRALEERAELQRRMARRLQDAGLAALASEYQERSAAAEQRAATIRSVLMQV